MYPSDIGLRENLISAHRASWQEIAQPGAFWPAADRVAFVEEARKALDCPLCRERKGALAPGTIEGSHASSNRFDVTLIDAIHRIRTDPGRLTRSWFDSVLESGVSQQAYVELVSVVTSSVIVDTMHASLGLELPALPAPAPGAPSGEFDDKTIDGGAWLPVMQAEQKMIEDVHMPTVPYIRRAMSLVPSAVRLFFQTFRPHYALIDVPLSISQAQAEFVAARVSALNECFY